MFIGSVFHTADRRCPSLSKSARLRNRGMLARYIYKDRDRIPSFLFNGGVGLLRGNVHCETRRKDLESRGFLAAIACRGLLLGDVFGEDG